MQALLAQLPWYHHIATRLKTSCLWRSRKHFRPGATQVILFLTLAWGLEPVFSAEPFVVKPYLQLGNRPPGAARESLELWWHTRSLLAAGRYSCGVRETETGLHFPRPSPLESRWARWRLTMSGARSSMG